MTPQEFVQFVSDYKLTNEQDEEYDTSSEDRLILDELITLSREILKRRE